MNKYFVIYRVPVETMDSWLKNTPPEEIKAQSEILMKDMSAWMNKHKGVFVGTGMPLGKTKTVTAQGVADTRNDLNYACVIEAESHEAATAIFADNPHITMIPNSSIDVMDIPHMGM
jgi:hypothetical protein